MLARCLFILSLIAFHYAQCLSAQEPFPLKPLPEQSLEWIREIESMTDFNFANRTAAAGAAYRILERSKQDNKLNLHSTWVLYLDAQYDNREIEAKTHLRKLRSMAPEDKVFEFDQMSEDTIKSIEMAKQKLDQIKQFRKKHPHYVPAIKAHCQLLQALSQEKEALDLVNGALKDSPHNELLHATKAFILLSLGKGKEALESSDTSLKSSPSNGYIGFIYFTRAKIMCELGRYSEAIQLAAAVNRQYCLAGQKKETARLLAFISRCYSAAGKYQLSYLTAKSASIVRPDLDESWLTLAEACVTTGRITEGLQAVEEYGNLFKKAADYHRIKILLLLAREENVEALKISDEAVKKFPIDTNIYGYHIYALLVSNNDANLKTANMKIAYAIKNSWKNPATWHYMEAISHTRSKNYPKAEEALKIARKKNSDPGFDNTLVEAQKDVADTREIRYPFAPEITDDAVHPDLILTLDHVTDLDFVSNKIIEAQCKDKLESSDEEYLHKLKAASVYLHYLNRSNNLDEAKKTIDQLVKAIPSNSHFKRRHVLIHQNNLSPSDQAKSLENFCAEHPEDEEGLGMWAVSLCKSNSYEKANEIADKVLKMSPNHSRGLHAKLLIAQHQGQFETALDYANQWICQQDDPTLHLLVYLLRAEILISLHRDQEALVNLSTAKNFTDNPQLLKDIRQLAAKAFKKLKKEALAEQALTSN